MLTSHFSLPRFLNSASCRTAASLSLVLPMMPVLAFVLLFSAMSCVFSPLLSAQMVRFTHDKATNSYIVTTDDDKSVHHLPMVGDYNYTSSPHRYLVKPFSLWGIIDAFGNIILPPMYEVLKAIEGQPLRFAAKMQNTWVLLDANGSILSAVYDNLHAKDIHYWDNTVRTCVLTQNGNLYGFIDTNGREIVAPVFQGYKVWFDGSYPLNCTSDPAATQVFWLQKADKWGLVSLPERQILPFQFDSVRVNVLNEKSIAFVQQQGKWGAVESSTGTVILPCLYEGIEAFNDSSLCLKSRGMWGVMSLSTSNANTVQTFLPFIFDALPEWSNYNYLVTGQVC